MRVVALLRDAGNRTPSACLTRVPVLDGWRATSILLVLAAHLLWLGPKALQLNAAAAAGGMALFFTLSGFLIASFLARGMQVGDFLVRRLARIVPLAWAAVLILILWRQPDSATAVRTLSFIGNLPPSALIHNGEHLWSLAVEMQFYLLAALLCLTFGRRGLYALPVLCAAVTMLRVVDGEHISIVTWHRVDEILSGATLALVLAGWFGEKPARAIERLSFLPCLALFVVSIHPLSGDLQFLRPYAATLLVASTLHAPPAVVHQLLVSRPMRYIAEVSYALYVVHGPLLGTWLASGDNKVVVYLKRPLLIGATFLIAHVSTRYFERPITRAAKNGLNFSGMARATSFALVQRFGVSKSRQ